jgi:hypothetical protein
MSHHTADPSARKNANDLGSGKGERVHSKGRTADTR